MKGIAGIGIALIILGVVGFAVGHIDFTTKEKVVDIGPLEITADKKHDIAIPDIAAGIALAAGLPLVFVGARKA
jgi:hypothetical protein